nr:MAG TPA: hypothetical protein [Caudoviricetes sp.]
MKTATDIFVTTCEPPFMIPPANSISSFTLFRRVFLTLRC